MFLRTARAAASFSNSGGLIRSRPGSRVRVNRKNACQGVHKGNGPRRNASFAGVAIGCLFLGGLMAITANTTTSALSAKSLIGTRVLNPKGENLGKLEDIVIEPEDGRVSFGIVSFGGFLGVGEKLFAVPLQAMKTSPEERAFVLNVDKEKLKNAP